MRHLAVTMDLPALLACLQWSQRDAAAALGCTRRDVRDALEGREPWLGVLCAACETALRLQETVQRELGPHRRG